jgi:hypothetical protein
MAKKPSFQELYARNQAEAEAESATPANDGTCPTITLNDLLGARGQRYSGGDLAPAEARSFDPLDRSFAFERGVSDLGGLADPNQAAKRAARPGAIALPDANADSLVLCGLSDTLTRTKRPERTKKK